MTLTTFDIQSAARIAATVRAVEGQPERTRGLSFDAISSSAIAQRQRPVFRIATFTGSWPKGGTKTVTLKYKTATPNTITATNLFAAIESSSSSRNCAIAREGSSWFLVAAEC